MWPSAGEGEAIQWKRVVAVKQRVGPFYAEGVLSVKRHHIMQQNKSVISNKRVRNC